MTEFIFEILESFYDEQTNMAVMEPKFKGKLVRCKDCIHNSLNRKGGNTCCDLGLALYQLDDYCSYGERRKDERSD